MVLLRRRCGLSDCLTLFLISSVGLIFVLVCTILYGTRTENPALPSLVKEVLPAGRCLCQSSTVFKCDTCLECAASPTTQIFGNATLGGEEGEAWAFDHRRDGGDLGLSEGQCEVAFPGLYEDLERAKKWRRGQKGKIMAKDLGGFKLTKGMVRVLVYNGHIYILETFLVDSVNREKALGVLSALHRALITAPPRTTFPNIEFVLSVEDLPAQPEKPIWQLARRAQDEDLWLMPDFGWWSWDVPQLGAFDEVLAEATARDSIEPWDKKQKMLVWRGKLTFAPKLRRAFIDATKGKSWADVGQVKWTDPDFKKQFKGPIDQCNYMFIAHLEGRSYSGALKYRQLCRSVIIAHKMQWIQHFHYLLLSSGPKQNYVEVERDFSDLSTTMDDLLAHPEKAKKIADNSVQTFRERYLTPAAEACYWRRLVATYADVLGFAPQLYEDVEDAVKRGNRRGVRFETFALYEPEKQMEYPKSAQ